MEFELYTRKIYYTNTPERQLQRLRKFLKPKIWRKLTSQLYDVTEEEEDEDLIGLLELLKRTPIVRKVCLTY